ncbi:MAG TPA: HNH endonuclease signature motif containing protein [Thermoanaerobaculia bacterium]|nr:HNH endonuclease signature motif containing protein [Thermoanaerobaculia bacterium]
MPRMTPSMARSAIKRALLGVLDRYPSKKQVARMWEFFDDRCVYCQDTLSRQIRNGHVDHLVAVAEGGTNRLSNFVLSCGFCNGDERRESNWDEFLRWKAGKDSDAYDRRRSKILAWVELNGGSPPIPDPITKAFVDTQIDIAFEAFNRAQNALIKLREGDA